MPLSRDFAFVVDAGVEAEKLVKAARGADKALISDVTVFDLYRLEDGRISLAIDVTLQPKDKTLTEAEIEAVSARIVAAVTKATGGVLRS
jgi:phenylalanyl-tRNA synthetase beta chain